MQEKAALRKEAQLVQDNFVQQGEVSAVVRNEKELIVEEGLVPVCYGTMSSVNIQFISVNNHNHPGVGAEKKQSYQSYDLLSQ